MNLADDNSLNNQPQLEAPTHKICGLINDFDVRNAGVRWQHGPGHSSKHGVYLFWARTLRDSLALARLQKVARDRAKAARDPKKKHKRN